MKSLYEYPLIIKGEELKSIREKNQITQKDVANRLEVSNATISKIEAGLRKKINLKTAELFSSLYRIPLDSIIDIPKKPKKDTSGPKEQFTFKETVRLGQEEVENGSYLRIGDYLWRVFDNHKLLCDTIVGKPREFDLQNNSLYSLTQVSGKRYSVGCWLNQTFLRSLKIFKDFVPEKKFNVYTSKGNFRLEVTARIGLLSEGEFHVLKEHGYFTPPMDSFWLMSIEEAKNDPSTYIPNRCRFVDEQGYAETTIPSQKHGVRPVIYLKENTQLTGTGTKEEPFEIVFQNNKLKKDRDMWLFDHEKARSIRESLNLTRQQVAEQVNYTAGYIATLELGDNQNPSFDMIYKLSDIYNVPVAALIKGDSDKTINLSSILKYYDVLIDDETGDEIDLKNPEVLQIMLTAIQTGIKMSKEMLS